MLTKKETLQYRLFITLDLTASAKFSSPLNNFVKCQYAGVDLEFESFTGKFKTSRPSVRSEEPSSCRSEPRAATFLEHSKSAQESQFGELCKSAPAREIYKLADVESGLMAMRFLVCLAEKAWRH